MPLTPVGLTAVLAPSLIASGMLGPGAPQLALGVATGTCLFAQQATVVTVDTGTLGVGASVAPFIVPQPLLLSSILVGMGAQNILGPMAPLMALGLANGLATGFLQGLLITTHPGIGAGAGVARVVAGTAVPSMIQGFASAGMKGQGATKKATALGIALDLVFKVFSIPIPIVGPPTPVGGAGAGFGKIV